MNKANVDNIGSFIYKYGLFDWNIARLVKDYENDNYILSIPSFKNDSISSILYASKVNEEYRYWHISLEEFKRPTSELIEKYGVKSLLLAILEYMNFERITNTISPPHLHRHLSHIDIQDEFNEIQLRGWCLIQVILTVWEQGGDHVYSSRVYHNIVTGNLILGVGPNFDPAKHDKSWSKLNQDYVDRGMGYKSHYFSGDSEITIIHGKKNKEGELVFYFWQWCPDDIGQNPWQYNWTTNVGGTGGPGGSSEIYVPSWNYDNPRWTEDTKDCMFAFDAPHATQLFNMLEEELLEASCGDASEYVVKSIVDNILTDLCNEYYQNQGASESGPQFPGDEPHDTQQTISSIISSVESSTIYQLGVDICEVCQEHTHPQSCIHDMNQCSPENYEECVDNYLCDYSIDNFTHKYGLNLSPSEKEALSSSCGPNGFDEDEAFTILADKYVDLALENISDGHRIRLLDCNSFQWNSVGSGWVSCLNPTNMEVEIGNTEIDLFIDMGCMSYTIPNTRVNDQGQIIQTISDEEASSCAAMASNLASVAVKLFMTIIPEYKLFNPNFIVKNMLKKVYKQAYSEAMEKTSCGNNPNLNMWSGSIATCTYSNCPSGGSTPIYSDNLIEVTEESILGECH